MFYEISNKELARYIGNTSFDLVSTKATSDVGKRINGFGKGANSYKCQIHNVDINVKNIKIDTFLDPKNDITCIIHIPPTKFLIITEELSSYYPNRDKLSFAGKTKPVDKKLVLRSVNPQSMDDFNMTLETVISAAEDYITGEIIEHRNHETWKVYCDNTIVDYDRIFHNER